MIPSTVWFMNARARRFLESTAIKARQILQYSGWLEGLQKGDIVAVKTHMGETYNVGDLRPVIISTLVDLLKERGMRPFVTDTTTMPYHPWTGAGGNFSRMVRQEPCAGPPDGSACRNRFRRHQ